MKKNKIFGLLAAASIVLGLTACNNSSDGTASNDTVNTSLDAPSTAGTVSNTTETDYAAFADSVERNSQSGYYLNPKTGKKLNLKVDRTSGAVSDANSGEPVWRYVDNRNWWVYGLDDDYTWDAMGEAQMKSDKLTYRSDDDKWVDYDARWSSKDENLSKTWKTKSGDVKIKFGKDGDIKIKDKDGKTKYDADDNKIKN
ncbi:MAG: hypothetical protein ACXWV9_06210 [Flavisolibacter sp.]